MADLSAQRMTLGGLQPTYAAAAGGGDTAPIGNDIVLHVKNGDASPHTVTIATPGTVGGLAVADASQVIDAGDEAFIPLRSVYRGPDGRAAISYDGVTSVTVAVLQLP
ncbi:hypothetical protein [Streptomyces sp. DH12]|uniref:hypothetical protein n=1 Tax=Streptomyces sp. DH12 TaxID=2857010 RepID=UPI001E560394|nr:hypothetical protein [Streptomyces sp. DH12]